MKRFIIIAVLICSSMAYADPNSLKVGIISAWQMNDNQADTSVRDIVHDHNGVAGKNTALLHNASGHCDGDMNALDNNISVKGFDSNLVSFTLSTWIKSNLGVAAFFDLLDMNTVGYTDSVYYIQIIGGNINFVVQTDTSDTALATAPGKGSLWNGAGWHNIIATWVSGTASIYVDGSFQRSGVASGNVAPQGGLLKIIKGAGATGQTSFIDDTVVWSRALSASEVAEYYSLGCFDFNIPEPNGKVPIDCQTNDCNSPSCSYLDCNEVDCNYQPKTMLLLAGIDCVTGYACGTIVSDPAIDTNTSYYLGEVNSCSTTKLWAKPNAGYHFVHWGSAVYRGVYEVNNLYDANTFIVNKLQHNWAEAYFAEDACQYTIHYIAGSGGGIDGNTTQKLVTNVYGTPVVADPCTGYIVATPVWSDGNTATTRVDRLTHDTNVTALFTYVKPTAPTGLIFPYGVIGTKTTPAASWYLHTTNNSPSVALTTADDMSAGTGDFTICGWIRVTTMPPSGGQLYLAQLSNTAPTRYLNFGYECIVGSPEYYYLYTNFNSTLIPGIQHHTDPNWHFIAITADRTLYNAAITYFDGNPEGAGDISAYSATDLSWATAYFMYNYGALSSAWDIDQVRMYKAALSQADLIKIYNKGHGGKVIESSYNFFGDGWYSDLDDGSGSTFTGRKRTGGVWTPSGGTISNVTWTAGGVPLP